MDLDRDPEKNLSAYIERNHALSLTCVHDSAGSPLHYIRGGILGKQPGTAYDRAIGCIHAGADRGPVLLQLFYFKLRACHGSQDRIRYACGDLFSLPEAVFPVLR